MRKLLILTVVFFLFACSSEKTKSSQDLLGEIQKDFPPYSLEIKVADYKKTDSISVLLLETTLWNNTNDTLKYSADACEWYSLYQFNNKNFYFDSVNCPEKKSTTISVIPQTNAKTFFKVNIADAPEKTDDITLTLKLERIENGKDSFQISDTLHLVSNKIKL